MTEMNILATTSTQLAEMNETFENDIYHSPLHDKSKYFGISIWCTC